MSQNKYIYLCNQELANISNAQIIKAFKLIRGINLDFIKKYDSTKVFLDLEDLNNFEDNFQSLLEKKTDPSFACQIKENINNNNLLDKLYISF